MDRLTVEYGQLPLETDLLYAQRFAMVGLAKNAETILGTGTIVDGFGLAPTSPTASMSLVLSPGVIYELENLEQTPWSSLGTDTHNIVKQGILLDAATVTFTAPGTVGYAQNYLVQVQYQDLDTGAVVRPYFDSANPAAPFEGPGNAGTADNTVRKGAVAYTVKAGSPAPSGTQAIPTPDAGYAGLWVVTVANGATSVTAGNIAMYKFAPFLPVKLPGVPAGVQNGDWVGADDTGTTNALAASVWPPVTSLKKYMGVRVKAAYSNTGATTFNLNGLGPVAIINKDGSALPAGSIPAGAIVNLTYDGTNWQKFTADAPPPAPDVIGDVALWHYGVGISSDANNIAVSTTPTFSAYVDGLQVCLKANNSNTGAVTMNANGFGPLAIALPNGASIPGGGIVAGQDYYFALNLSLNKWILMAPALTQAGALVQTAAFMSGGNYSLAVPSWATCVRARIWGGGGGGGNGNNGAAGGGAGGGEYREGSWLVGNGQPVASGGTLSITVGSGGSANSSAGGSGANGGTTQISGLIVAVGGTGGQGSQTPYAYMNGSPGGSGGSGGVLTIPGSAGGNGSAYNTAEGGGAFGTPNAPNQFTFVNAAGVAGAQPGGGGGGSAATFGNYPPGGKGGDGAVIIEFGS